MYQILSSESAGKLCFEVNKFMEHNMIWDLYGGPYSDGKYHYQCFIKIKPKKLLKG